MNSHRIISPITKILWAGWESSTYTLQQSGWQISVEQDIMALQIRIAIKHPNFRIYGISNLIPYRDFQDKYMSEVNFSPLPPIRISYMASRMEINLYDNLSKFIPIDAEPSFVEVQKKSIEDFMIFRPINKANEIIVAQQEIPDLLNLILSKQDPKQKDIREKKRREWRQFVRNINEAEVIKEDIIEDNKENIVAQLISL